MYAVYIYKTDAMKALQQAVSRGGYTRYCYNKTDAKNLEKLIYKFEDRYKINATKQMRYRAKKRGEANTKLILLKDRDSNIIHFWLMVSNGSNVIEEMEKLYSVTDKKNRLTITHEKIDLDYDDYELVRIQKNDDVKKTSSLTWTWQMTKEYYADFEQQIIDSCRHKQTDLIRQCFYSLQHMPVFSKMRLQAYALYKTLTKEYAKSHNHKYSEKLVKNFYCGYKKATTIDAITLSKKARRIKEPVVKVESVKISLHELIQNEIKEIQEYLNDNSEQIYSAIERGVITGKDTTQLKNNINNKILSIYVDRCPLLNQYLKIEQEKCFQDYMRTLFKYFDSVARQY